MNILRGDIVLPNLSEALGVIRDFTELDPTEIKKYTTLAHSLGGMSTALSVVALDYGETHRYPGIESNVGLWTTIGEGSDSHKFTVTAQDIFGLSGAQIWRSAIEGGTDRYYDLVTVPTEEVLEEFLAADPNTLRQGWDQPHWTDIYATRVRTPDQDERSCQNYWPFNLPIARPADYPQTPEESAVGYTQVLQDLSKTVLEVVGQ